MDENRSVNEPHPQVHEPENNSFILHDRIFIRSKDKMVKVLFDSILNVEAERNYCRIFTTGKDYLLTMPMKNLEMKLPVSLFQRIHRSYIVNLQLVDEVSESHVYIQGKPFPLSHTLKSEVLQRFNMI